MPADTPAIAYRASWRDFLNAEFAADLKIDFFTSSWSRIPFWLNLQQSYDLSKTRIEEEKQIVHEVHAYRT
jgi:plasmid maintenance system antidote protein VapI